MAYRFKNSSETLSKKRALGVAIELGAMRAIEFKAFAKHLEVERSFEKLFSEQISENGILRASKELFRELLKGGKCKSVSISIPESLIYTTLMRIPKSPEKDIKSLVELHLENHMKYVKNSFLTTCTTVLRTKDANYVRVLVFQKKLIDDLKASMKNAKGKILSFEGNLSSSARAVLTEKSLPTLIINLNKLGTEIGVYAFGEILQTNVFSEGFNYLIDTVIKNTGKKTNEINASLKKYGITNRLDKDIYRSLLLGLAPIIDGIKSAMIHFHAHLDEMNAPSTPIREIVIVGDSSYLSGLSEYISRETRTHTTIANPWATAHLEDGNIPFMPIREALKYTSAIGGGLKDLKSN